MYADTPNWVYHTALVGFGLLFGSFANVVIWRLPRGESLAQPGSHCPVCGAPIAWVDNIPVLSWLLLRGRCRSCAVSISIRYPLVEALSGILWLVAGLRFGMSWMTAITVLLFYTLLILTFIDIDHQRLPNVLVGALGVVGLLGVVVSGVTDTTLAPLVGVAKAGTFSRPWSAAALGVVLGGGASLLLSLGYGAVRGKTGLGMGDVKLLGVLGLFTGPYILMVLMLGSIMGAVYGILAMRGNPERGSTRIPFGPFLAAGAAVTVVVGPDLWSVYAKLVGLA